MREKVLGSYARAFGCNLEEAEVEEITSYRNLGELFRRSLKPELRPIAPGHDTVVSPADATVIHLGKVEEERIEQVKGLSYSLRSFIGPQTWRSNHGEHTMDSAEEYHQGLCLKKGEMQLYHCVLYLAPGDYHRFHSPADWSVDFRRHFPGALLSVRPSFISWIEGLFNINERVSYIGHWTHGFFSFTAVGATNVGSIKVYFDDELRTNKWIKAKTFLDKEFLDVKAKKGQSFGEFNLGSTIVLIFEAPPDFQFNVECGQKVKFGQSLFESKAPVHVPGSDTEQEQEQEKQEQRGP
jgi:phosphatidylserine decarboxylase